jgi:hypothetical protein
MRSISTMFAALILLGASNAVAAPIGNPPDPAKRAYTARIIGTSSATPNIKASKTVHTGGWNNLAVGAPANPQRGHVFISKDTWLVFANTSVVPPQFQTYIEAGLDSSLSTPAAAQNAQLNNFATVVSPGYKGYFAGTTLADNNANIILKTFIYGGNGTGTAQTGGTVEIEQTNAATSTWVVKYNGTTALTLAGVKALANSGGGLYGVVTPAAATELQVGIESNDTTNTFTNGTSMIQSYKLGTSSVYTFSPVSGPYDNNTFSWYSTYTPATGKVTLNK